MQMEGLMMCIVMGVGVGMGKGSHCTHDVAPFVAFVKPGVRSFQILSTADFIWMVHHETHSERTGEKCWMSKKGSKSAQE